MKRAQNDCFQVPDQVLLEKKTLLRPDEVARILRISLSQVYYMCSIGELECTRIGERRTVRVPSRAVKRILHGD